MTPDEIAWAQECLLAGDTLEEIAAAAGRPVKDFAGLPPPTAEQKRKARAEKIRAGLHGKRRGGPGGKVVNAARDAEIRRRKAEGQSLNALAAAYGLTKQRVSMIVKAGAPVIDRTPAGT